MRFKEFLMSEDGVSARHQQAAKMTLEQMVEWVENNAMEFLSNDCPPIYRGVDSLVGVEGLYNGASLNRKAANTLNYANMWMSNAHEWAKYPSRSKSFICTTDKEYAESYGTVYRIIPSDSSMIGICPSEDLWISFPNLKKLGKNMTMKDFMTFTDETTQMFGSKGGMENDWDVFAGHLNKVDLAALSGPIDKSWLNSDISEEIDAIKTYMQKNQLETMFELYSDIFSPKGFELETASSFNTTGRHEVWMSGSILMVSAVTWRQILNKIENG